jgi:hypothetical protein
MEGCTFCQGHGRTPIWREARMDPTIGPVPGHWQLCACLVCGVVNVPHAMQPEYPHQIPNRLLAESSSLRRTTVTGPVVAGQILAVDPDDPTRVTVAVRMDSRVDGQCAGSTRAADPPPAQEAHTQPGESEAASQDVRRDPDAEWRARIVGWMAEEAGKLHDNALAEGRRMGFAAACARIRAAVEGLETGWSVHDPEREGWVGARVEIRRVIDRIAGGGA